MSRKVQDIIYSTFFLVPTFGCVVIGFTVLAIIMY